jgi:TolB protein
MDADGANPVNLTNNAADEQLPSWSPDAGRIAFASDRTGNFELFLVNPDGAAVLNISNNAALVDAPGSQAWGP